MKGPIRRAFLPAESEPVIFGVHGAVADTTRCPKRVAAACHYVGLHNRTSRCSRVISIRNQYRRLRVWMPFMWGIASGGRVIAPKSSRLLPAVFGYCECSRRRSRAGPRLRGVRGSGCGLELRGSLVWSESKLSFGEIP